MNTLSYDVKTFGLVRYDDSIRWIGRFICEEMGVMSHSNQKGFVVIKCRLSTILMFLTENCYADDNYFDELTAIKIISDM